MNNLEAVNYLNNNSFTFRLPENVESFHSNVQSHFNKGNLVSVRIDVDKSVLNFEINLDEDSQFGEYVSIDYKFKSLGAIIKKLYPNIVDFESKRFEITSNDEVIFSGVTTLLEAQKVAETFRIANPTKGVSTTFDFSEDGMNSSFIGSVTWEDQLSMFTYYPTFTEEGSRQIADVKA